MFLKPIIRHVRGTLDSYIYYRLCESYRDEYGSSKWRSLMGLGRMEGFSKEQRTAFINRLNEMLKGSLGLFSACEDAFVEQFAIETFNTLRESGKIDMTDILQGGYQKREDEMKQARAELVKASSLRHKEVREIGSEYMCLETAKKLQIDKYLQNNGFTAEEIQLTLTQIVARAVHPASELATVDWVKNRSAICQLTGYDATRLTKDKLYRNAIRLLEQQEGLVKHLSRWTREMFALDDSIILYDLTNTYFEGQMRSSKLAKRGRSKEKRSDCKLLVLAMVINQDGFPKHYQLFEGNMSDAASLTHLIDSLDRQLDDMDKKPVVVMDAGIATDGNRALLRSKGYDYVCVSRSTLKEYSAQEKDSVVRIADKKEQPIDLCFVNAPNETDRFLWVRSEAKALKERSMKEQASTRFEEELQKIKASLARKGGVKRADKVNQRIGRAKQKYPSVQSHYDIDQLVQGDVVTALNWSLKPEYIQDETSGVYFLRTTLPEKEERTIWMIYNIIREVEYTFSVLKSDLDLRPIYHKTDTASLAHLHLGILAYWLVVTIRHQLKQKGINKNWRHIVEVLDSHKTVTSTMERQDGKQVVINRCSEPSEQVVAYYQATGIDPVPHKPTKSVRYQMDDSKNSIVDCLDIRGG